MQCVGICVCATKVAPAGQIRSQVRSKKQGKLGESREKISVNRARGAGGRKM